MTVAMGTFATYSQQLSQLFGSNKAEAEVVGIKMADSKAEAISG